MKSSLISVSDEVRQALKKKQPVVALESTIISHGMPFPQNFETALKLESVARKSGVIPATIAVINGKVRAGLSKSEIKFLSTEKNILKCSRLDLPLIVAQKLSAATTVSATMLIAKAAGIRIFATGGIGGVHRGAQETFDISADLTELAQTSVAVVSAGVKSILDIGLTLEYLETMGVPVIGYRTNDFPAFFARESGFRTNYRLDSPKEIADVINAKEELNLKGGILVANPVPEEYSMDRSVIENAISSALKTARRKKIIGKDITPFLLSEIVRITKGRSLETNISLVENNVKLASRIAGYLK